MSDKEKLPWNLNQVAPGSIKVILKRKQKQK